MADRFYERVGANIRKRREYLGCTQEIIAQDIGISRTAFVNIEAGRQGIAVHRLLEIADALGTTLAVLLRGVQRPES